MITKPKGCYDIYGDEAKKLKYINAAIDDMMERYNYTYIRTPIIENTNLFHRSVGLTSDIVTKETYDFKDRANRPLTLRPEGTAGVVRSYIENKMYGDNQLTKLYYNGTMYRYERPQAGRDRELTQFGCEVIGSYDEIVDAEVISIPVNLFKTLGLKNVLVKINSIGDEESRANYRDALVEHFKKYEDTLCEDCKHRLGTNPLRILDCKVDKDKECMKSAPKISNYLNQESKERFLNVQTYLEAMNIDYEIDETLVRGLDYYNHTVFEIEATVENFGSNNVLAGGGGYSGLIKKLDGPDDDGIGFAVGISRLLLALDSEKINLPINNSIDIFIMYVNNEEKLVAAGLVQDLRMKGYIVETEYNNKGLKSQFKRADKLNSKLFIILNSEELASGNIKIKNNKTKQEDLININYLEYYIEEALTTYDIEEDYIEHGKNCNCNHDHECGGNCKCHDKHK